MTDDDFIDSARRLAVRFQNQPLGEIRKALLVAETSLGGREAQSEKTEHLATILLTRRSEDTDAQSPFHFVRIDDHDAVTPLDPEVATTSAPREANARTK